MAHISEKPNIIPWPPILLLVALVSAALLGIYLPFGWPSGIGAEVLQGVGIVFAFVAVALYGAAAREMTKAQTTLLPHKGSEKLVTTGPYRVSRNPIYLANVILLASLGLIFANGWMLIAAGLSGFAEQKLAIEREEAHLEHRFGKAWRDYKKRVRRWI